MKRCVWSGASFLLGNISATRGLEPETTTSAGQCLLSELLGLPEKPRKSFI